MATAARPASILLLALALSSGAPGQSDPASSDGPPPTRPDEITPGEDSTSSPDEPLADTDSPGTETVDAPAAVDPGWPRSFEGSGNEVTLYQPQLTEWADYTTLVFRAAVAVRTEGADEPIYGVIDGSATTRINHADRTVLIDDPSYATSFPDLPDTDVAALTDIVTEALRETRSEMVIDLDRLIANVERSAITHRSIDVGYDPPPIFVTRHAAVLVIFMGEPRFAPIPDTSLAYALNTNWDVIQDPADDRVYLLLGGGWVSTDDPVTGRWSAVTELPEAFATLPDDASWSEVRAFVPGQPLPSVPKIHVATAPAELIVLDGPPSLALIPGTEIMYAANTGSDLFLSVPDQAYYCLIAGRWFSAPTLDGPWRTASADLPASFAAIPPAHPKAHVLASIAGTPEAEEAVIQASIPHKATVARADLTIEIAYDGEPDFEPIADADGVRAAVNARGDAVFKVGTRYYCCRDGIWFEAAAPDGPWIVSDAVPKEIYTIPAESPYHNVTYVQVYDATPTEVTTGYTSGYTGSYVAAGVVVFGAAVTALALSDADVRIRVHTGYRPPSWYSYGCHAQYAHYRGGWVRGASHYGPYGGAGYGARYNPRTGAYARGALAYGPRQSAAVVSASNPWTGRGAASAQRRTPYGSWGSSVVYEGNDWARFGHRSGPYGTAVGYRTSDGDAGVRRIGPRPTRHVYAGPDGNVYRVGANDQWQRRSQAGWESTRMKSHAASAPGRDARARAATARRSGAGAAEGPGAPGARGGRRYLDASPGSPDVQRYLNAQSRSRQRGMSHTQRRSSLGRRGGRSSGGRRR